MADPLSAYVHRSTLVDSTGVQSEGVNKVANYVWDSATLAWIKSTGSGGGGGGSVTQGTIPWIGDSVQAAVRFDSSASPILYYGEAAPGSAESSAVWRIQRIDTSSGVTITWPGGSAAYNQAWSNRAILFYS
jgi:hypothetical protein